MAKHRRPSRATKALIAGGAATILLAAGGGTFARWYDESSIVANSTFSSGTLTIDAAAGTWTDANGAVITNPGSYLMVPGTSLTYTTTLDVVIVGAGMTGVVTTNFAGIVGTSELGEALQVGLTLDDQNMTVQDTQAASTELTQSGTHTVVMTVTFPEKRADGTNWGTFAQTSTADLSAFSFAISQGTAAPAPSPTV